MVREPGTPTFLMLKLPSDHDLEALVTRPAKESSYHRETEIGTGTVRTVFPETEIGTRTVPPC